MATIQVMLGSNVVPYDLKRRFEVIAKKSNVGKIVGGHKLVNPLQRPGVVVIKRTRKASSIDVVCAVATTTPSAEPSVVDTWETTVSQPDTFSQYSGYIADAAVEEADALNAYNADKFATIFKKRPFLLARRLVQIAGTLGGWAALRSFDSLMGRSDTNFKKRAGQLRAALVQLGPAFVKIAQAVSSRPDVIAPEYLAELELLQDRIAPFSTELALNIIEQELGVPVEHLFSEISPQPVAAASLGQVYQARLRPSGEAVAVKVQRPGVRAAMALDLFILRKMVDYARVLLRLNTDLAGVVDEWGSSVFREMDYQAEARNGVRFRKMFGTLPDVFIPEMFTELTSRRVLVMQWVEGQRLSEVNDLRLVEVGVNCSLTQLLDSGFYHADPHPGNLMRTPDGKLAYLDFGMMGEMKENLRDGLIEASLHLVNREFDELASDFVTLGLLPPTAEMGALSQALTGVFQEAISKGVRNISFGDLSGKLGVTMYQFKFRIPSYFSLVIRSLTVLEGIALSTDPNYKVLSSSYPWIARKVLTDKSPQLQSTLRSLLYKDGSFRIDRLESLMTEAMRSQMENPEDLEGLEERKGSTSEEDARNLVKRILTFALTEQGDFVRDLLLDELAKGLDALNRAAFDMAAKELRSRAPFALPALAPLTEGEDVKHLHNLQQLTSLLSGSSTNFTNTAVMQVSSTSKSDMVVRTEVLNLTDTEGSLTWDEVSVLLQRMSSLFQYTPMLSVVPELPFSAQQQAVLLPAELATRLASRFLARSIRGSIPKTTSRFSTVKDNSDI
ncbi:unnamed protein product [Sphagnum troendelagicum]|uniref:Protein kinase domain-containing protein n=1 Tax=Sphagnum troendelagicum TaxID=128251 RepID=A0ABP0UXR6_9BRYO